MHAILSIAVFASAVSLQAVALKSPACSITRPRNDCGELNTPYDKIYALGLFVCIRILGRGLCSHHKTGLISDSMGDGYTSFACTQLGLAGSWDVSLLHTCTGYYGITFQECTSKGCCWGPTTSTTSRAQPGSSRTYKNAMKQPQSGLKDTPWCFYPNGPSEDTYLVQSVHETGRHFPQCYTPQGHC